MNFYRFYDISRSETIVLNPKLICYYKYNKRDNTVQIVFNTRDYAVVSVSDFKHFKNLEGVYEW